MNTKIILLFLVLHLVPLSVSSDINSDNQMSTIEITSVNNDHVTVKPHTGNAFPWEILLHNFSYKKHGHHHEEDGKHHHIHFERVVNHKWRWLFCLFGKMIILITYLCSLASFYAQYL